MLPSILNLGLARAMASSLAYSQKAILLDL